jgi:hypothetical protein
MASYFVAFHLCVFIVFQTKEVTEPIETINHFSPAYRIEKLTRMAFI